MELSLSFLLIIFPFIIALVLLLRFKWQADSAGYVTWFILATFALLFFDTDIIVILLASLAGIVASFPISLMVGSSILMITYMQQTGALKRVIIFFKTLGGGGSKGFQIMFLNLGLGTFLVSIGATPISILPPIMLAMGYSGFVAVALPALGYDPLTTFALLSIPAVVFADIMGIPLQEAGIVFSWFMPVITTGIAFGMLFIAGGFNELRNRESILYAIVSGLTAGFTTILVNILGLTTLTGVFAGLAVMIVSLGLTKILGYEIIDESVLTEEEIEFAKQFPLIKSLSPWIILISLSVITNVGPLYIFLFKDLALPITIGTKEVGGLLIPAITVYTRVFWQAYFWVLVSTILSMFFLAHDNITIRRTMNIGVKRAIRPMLAASVFFAVAYVLNHSGTLIDNNNLWISARSHDLIDDVNNMVYVLALVTQNLTGNYYALAVPFIGLFGGFVTGSETSAIAMFTNYHKETSIIIGVDPVIIGASNGIGGGLASVLSPAKIANAAAVIDKPGIEGEIIQKTAPIALILVWLTSLMTFIFTMRTTQYFVPGLLYSLIPVVLFVGYFLLIKPKITTKDVIDELLE
ncbi:MAG: L-lactate permease [Candidatus Heimdallarchaeota archaeon]|nr:L-lactate permease [Candidatus Heimdallarchaeota archaeon]